MGRSLEAKERSATGDPGPARESEGRRPRQRAMKNVTILSSPRPARAHTEPSEAIAS